MFVITYLLGDSKFAFQYHHFQLSHFMSMRLVQMFQFLSLIRYYKLSNITECKSTNICVLFINKDLETLKRISEHASRTQGLDIMNPSSGCTLHINETKIKTMSGSFVHSAAPTLVSIVTENLLGFKINSPTRMVSIHLCKLVIVECGQQIKLHRETEKKPGDFTNNFICEILFIHQSYYDFCFVQAQVHLV